MHGRRWMIGFLVWTAAPRSTQPQSRAEHIRFHFVDPQADRRWVGHLVGITTETLYVRPDDADSVVAFDRAYVRSLERGHRRVGDAAAVGCLAVGGSLAFLSYVGSSDGFEEFGVVLGAVVGCGLGALGGAILGWLHKESWEAWTVPPPTARSDPREAADPSMMIRSAP